MTFFKNSSIILLLLGSLFVIVTQPTKLGLDLQGGLHLVLEAQESEKQKVTPDAIQGSLEVIRNRIDSLGLTEPVIRAKGKIYIQVNYQGLKKQ